MELREAVCYILSQTVNISSEKKLSQKKFHAILRVMLTLYANLPWSEKRKDFDLRINTILKLDRKIS